MDDNDTEALLRRLTFSDVKFLRDFFAALDGAETLAEVGRRLKIPNAANLHHRLARARRHFAQWGPVNVGTRLTPEGEELSARVKEIWRSSAPLLPLRPRSSRLAVHIAMPEVMTGRSFTELVRRLQEQAWGNELDLITRRDSPARLATAVETSKGRDDLVMTLTRANESTSSPRAAPKKKVASTNLRRVLIALNGDPMAARGRPGGVALELLRNRAIYLPPHQLLPGFCFQRLEDLCDIHPVSSFADAHAYALNVRGAMAVAHPELLDEVEDKLCTTILLDADIGQTRLELHRPRRAGTRKESGARAEMVKRVYEVVELHLKEIGLRSSRAERLNEALSVFKWMAHTSDAPTLATMLEHDTSISWRWRYSNLEDFHVTALGHLKGRQGALEDKTQRFDIFGRIMESEGVGGRHDYHILWRSVDHQTLPGATEPQVEHFSVNMVFNEADLKGGVLAGLWSGRRSGPGAWVPGCGVIILAGKPLSPADLKAAYIRFIGRLDHWKDPAD